jgi:hypothetical protein
MEQLRDKQVGDSILIERRPRFPATLKLFKQAKDTLPDSAVVTAQSAQIGAR